MDYNKVLQTGKDTLNLEINAVKRAMERLGDDFVESVELIMACKGRVVVTGMGKSGIIGKKIAATLASTGTPAFFLHPAEGMHGDLGMLVKGDVVIAVSNSGETDEIKVLLPLIKRLSLGLISIVGNLNSTLAQKSDCILDASVEREACSLNLAPTSSTTVALALGDALAVALIEMRGFKAEDFAKLHPSGALGKRLLITVKDLMHIGSEIPSIYLDTKVKDVVAEINIKHFGCAAVLNNEGQIKGIITDGDLRRAMAKFSNVEEMRAEEIMTFNPKLIDLEELAASALYIMEKYKISSLFIVDKNNKPVGLLHFQDLLKSGLV